MKAQIFGMTAAIALLLTAGAGSARADITFQLNVDHCTGGCIPGAPGTSGGTVTLSTVATGNVLVTVTLFSPLKFVNSGIDDVIDFNIAGSPTITVDGFTNTNFQLDPGNPGSHHFDGFGNFDYAVGLKASLGSGAGSAQSGPLSFNVHAAGITENSFDGSSTGTAFGVDVINTVNSNTGPIGTSSSAPNLSTGGGTVPEPTSIILFGTIFAGVAVLQRRKARRTV